jgi:very-short-patch-repair endonuclease
VQRRITDVCDPLLPLIMRRISIVSAPITPAKLARARAFRRNMTPAERALWNRVRNNQLGVHFRRQQVIFGFIVDFYCDRARLVVEVDGGIHNDPEVAAHDAHRSEVLKSAGLRILRVSNEDVLEAMTSVLDRISRVLKG